MCSMAHDELDFTARKGKMVAAAGCGGVVWPHALTPNFNPKGQTVNAPEQRQHAFADERQVSDFERLLDQSYSPRAMLEGDSMDKMMRMAEQMASSKLSVPEHLRNNVGDCFAVVMQAMLWNMHPFAVAQKTHLVNGKLGYEAQLVNAVVQNSGAVSSLPAYEYRGEGDGLECRVGFVPRGGTQIVWNEFLRFGSVTTKNSPLWKTNPKQQLGYLQIKNWARAYCPGALLGVYTTDELEQQGAGFNEQNTSITEPGRGPRRRSESQTQASTAPAQDAAEQQQSGQPEQPQETAPKPAASAPTGGAISGGQIAYLRNKLKAASITEQTICDRFQVAGLEHLTADQFDAVKAELLQMG
jgi:hypothetical protein